MFFLNDERSRSNIIIIFLLSTILQPCDAGIIKAFKAHYGSLLVDYLIEQIDNGPIESGIYDIDEEPVIEQQQEITVKEAKHLLNRLYSFSNKETI